MQLLLTILAFFVIFSLLILVHEFGHFYMAKRHGIKVEEFGFGLPPRIWGVKKGETLYSLNWIPFGGFVRMLGEDSRDKKARRSPRSFMRKSLWQRTQVVCAGVVMNFLLAWVLLSAGFMVGMQPLIVDGDEFLSEVAAGTIEIEHGVVVVAVAPGSWAEAVGFEFGDRLVTVNGQSFERLSDLESALSSGDPVLLNGIEFVPTEATPEAGLTFNLVELPRVVVGEVESASIFQEGDLLYSVNGETVFYSLELFEALFKLSTETVLFEVIRDGNRLLLLWTLPEAHRVVITEVLSGSPAESGGLQAGDVVWRINGQDIWAPEQAVEVVTSSTEATVQYEVQRQGELLSFTLSRNEEGLVGVLLSSLFSPSSFDFSTYDGVELVSIVNVQAVQYAWIQAPLEALSEMKRLSGYTAVMLAKVFGQIFTSGNVPDEVAGPVGIAQMTHAYVQEGLVALIRFTALLSLSLAVINIFPFPALDGGRFLFLLIELIRGKPIDTKVEGLIHSLGFVFLLIVIFLVTFQDLQRLFMGS